MVTGFTLSGWGKLLDLLYVQLNRTSFFPLDYLPFRPRSGSTFISAPLGWTPSTVLGSPTIGDTLPSSGSGVCRGGNRSHPSPLFPRSTHSRHDHTV